MDWLERIDALNEQLNAVVPIGVQLAAPLGEDARLLALMGAPFAPSYGRAGWLRCSRWAVRGP